MIYLRDISLSFADRKIFEKINWTITDRGRVGLVGDNGTGKTTMLRAILGDVDLDGGSIEITDRKRVTIGYLPQDLVELEPVPLMDYLRRKAASPNWRRRSSNARRRSPLPQPMIQTTNDA